MAVAFGLSLASLTGCVHQGTALFDLDPGTADDQPVGPPNAVWEVAVEPAPVDVDATEAVLTPPSEAPPRIVPRDPVFFHMGAGYGALGRVDLTPCKSEGLTAGYLRMRVTFQPSGRIVRAAVESAVAPPREALECISEQLEAAAVPFFEGGDVTLSRSFFVN